MSTKHKNTMAGFTISGLLLKFTVTVFGIAFHNLIAMQFVIIGLQKLAVSGLEVTPLWDETTNTTQPCAIDTSNTDLGMITFDSNSDVICSLQVSASSGNGIVIGGPKRYYSR